MSDDMDAVGLVALRERSLSLDECLDAVRRPGAGGNALFLGTVRDNDAGRPVVRLCYEAHPTAAALLREVAERVAGQGPGCRLAALHRTGELAVGEMAMIVAVSSPHRGEAFSVCRRLVDDIKRDVPIWKRQVFADGTAEWVGSGCGQTP
ncbi:MAG: molybdenum cofactor biosynthesis protein MoaE [Frankiaceae bacterium]